MLLMKHKFDRTWTSIDNGSGGMFFDIVVTIIVAQRR
jgi:hypothetical protein